MNAALTPQHALHELLQDVGENPYGYDLFNLLRQVESCISDYPPLGRAQRYRHEPLQLGQEPSCAFASASVAKLYHYKGKRKSKLSIYSFGLFGPNGPMPLVFTEYARERMTHQGDGTLSDFVDVFHNRLIMLFYRAWANAQSCASLDRPNDSFSRHVASLTGLGIDPHHSPDSIANHSRWYHSGHLVQQSRSAEGLTSILNSYFNVPVKIEQFVAHWLELPADQRSRLGGVQGAQLGFDSVLGTKVMDRQQHFRIHLGPLSSNQYEQFLPARQKYVQLREWVRNYVGIELSWDLRLILCNREQTAGMQLGQTHHLGWNSWLGERDVELGHLGDAILRPETQTTAQQQAVQSQQTH
ncbi:type VI secretion system baseplate subunit TssG [Gilvimarinus japonicus]|uniref:Type VI secretion system baseplate subunit TssG n=1 Tax=Gilvimarinus japonicus TaxID=1796469 RepID=A0ABV7HJ25_9GAMM